MAINASVQTLLVGMNAGAGNRVVPRKLNVKAWLPTVQFSTPFWVPIAPELYDTVVEAEPPFAGTMMLNGDTVNAVLVGWMQVTVAASVPGLVKLIGAVVAAPPKSCDPSVISDPEAGVVVNGT